MGKTKIKTIDDSKPQEEVKKKPRVKSAQKQDTLVERLKEELGVDQSSVVSGQLSDSSKPVSRLAGKQKTVNRTKPRSKKYQEAVKEIDSTKKYPLTEAVEQTIKSSYTKFDGTLEIHINTSAKGLKGLVSMPNNAGKKLTILAFGPTSLGELRGVDAENLILGTEETIEEISKGKLNFDVVVTTPEWMPKLAKVARVLGPRGLMPNPQNNTITQNLEKVVKDLRSGKTEYKTEPNGQVIHLPIGKVTQNKEEIVANVKALYNVLGRSKVTKITLSPTMGPGIKVDLGSI